MAITDIPILSMLRTRMEWAQERQRVLAENVANADTPSLPRARSGAAEIRYPGEAAPRRVTTVALARTESGHIAGHRAERLAVPQPRPKAITRCARPATR